MIHLSIEYKFSKKPTSDSLGHPLISLLESVNETGSIGKGATLTPETIKFLVEVTQIKNRVEKCVSVLKNSRTTHRTKH